MNTQKKTRKPRSSNSNLRRKSFAAAGFSRYLQLSLGWFFCLLFSLSLAVNASADSDSDSPRPHLSKITKDDSGGIITFVAENDVLRGTDQHYTHGTRISYYSGEIRDDWLNRVAELMPYFKRETRQESWRANIAIGQNMYTPSDITVKELMENERPYAGYVYLGLGIVRAERGKDKRPDVIDSFELQLGVVGPLAYAGEVQTWWHANVSDSPEPMGWDHQLANEPIINLNWDRQWRSTIKDNLFERPGSDLKIDMIPHLGVALGNANTHLATGLSFRLGKGLDNDNGPPRIRPSLPGAGYFKKNPSWGGYLFVGVESRLIGRNIFLDGNTFKNSHSVNKKLLGIDGQYGIVLSYKSFKLAVTNIIRAQEFRGQPKPDRFTAFSFSWHL